MDVDDTDLPSNAAETSLVPIETHELGDGIFVTVVDGGKDTQAQWDVVFFLQNLFTTRDEDKLRDHFVTKKKEIEKIHEKLWPDYEVPPLLESKHGAVKASEGNLYLKRRCMPTTLSMSWLVWSVSMSRRMPADRRSSQLFLRKFLQTVLVAAGTLQFTVKTIGTRRVKTKTLQVSTRNSCLHSSDVWSLRLQEQIQPEWEARLGDRQDEQVSSSWDRPEWIDLILFSLDPKNKRSSPLLTPVAYSILEQTAEWIDSNVGKLALRTSDALHTRQKNRTDNTAVTRYVAIEAAVWLLFENDSVLFDYYFLFSNMFFQCLILYGFVRWQCL